MLNQEGKTKRVRQRMKLPLPVRVFSREAGGREWSEMTRLENVTPFGAAFLLKRPTEPGRLLSLTLPLPRQLRCFDHAEPQYHVWSLVRYVRQEASPTATDSPPPKFIIGVAFVGKHPPASYLADPVTRYEVASPSATSSLYSLREAAGAGDGGRQQETRLQMAVEVSVEVLDEGGAVAAREATVTENISRRGASVFSALKVERGRFVRLTSTQFKLSLLAAVRASRTGPDGIPRLHLEFVGEQWPLEGIA